MVLVVIGVVMVRFQLIQYLEEQVHQFYILLMEDFHLLQYGHKQIYVQMIILLQFKMVQVVPTLTQYQ